MRTPARELESKYSIEEDFTEGKAHARGRNQKEFLGREIVLCARDATRLLLLASRLLNS
jgi:hypothetical protein